MVVALAVTRGFFFLAVITLVVLVALTDPFSSSDADVLVRSCDDIAGECMWVPCDTEARNGCDSEGIDLPDAGLGNSVSGDEAELPKLDGGMLIPYGGDLEDARWND